MVDGARQLLLIRHAHADAGGGSGGDQGRRLNARGEDAATRLGQWIAARDRRIDRLVASSATRTTQTASLVAAALEGELEVELADELYLATPRTLMHCVAQADNTVTCLALVAHNPGVWEFAAQTAERCGQLVENYAPATCLVFEFAGAWASFPRLSPRVVAQWHA